MGRRADAPTRIGSDEYVGDCGVGLAPHLGAKGGTANSGVLPPAPTLTQSACAPRSSPMGDDLCLVPGPGNRGFGPRRAGRAVTRGQHEGVAVAGSRGATRAQLRRARDSLRAHAPSPFQSHGRAAVRDESAARHCCSARRRLSARLASIPVLACGPGLARGRGVPESGAEEA